MIRSSPETPNMDHIAIFLFPHLAFWHSDVISSPHPLPFLGQVQCEKDIKIACIQGKGSGVAGRVLRSIPSAFAP